MLLSRSQLVSRGAVRASVRPAPVRSAVLVRAKAAEAEVISKKDDKKKQEGEWQFCRCTLGRWHNCPLPLPRNS